MKKKIALFANGWNGENLDHFIEGFMQYFTHDELDVFAFVSHASFSLSDVMHRAEDSFYTMPDYSFFDAVIIFGSGINSNEAVENMRAKCREANVPVIMQGLDVDDIPCVTIDNYIGMRELCEHLVEKHNVKDTIFIGGPAENEDSNLRLKALREALMEHGFGLSDEDVLYANWETSVVSDFILSRFEDKTNKLPDAFVCANDQMAMSTIMSLEMIGYKVPDDVIVSGFDNMNEGRVFYPSIASVDQCYIDQGNECAKFLIELFEDKTKLRKKIVPCTATPGESCGCYNCKNETESRKLLGHDAWINKFVSTNAQGRQLHIEKCIISDYDYDAIGENISNDFFATTGVEGDDFHIYLNPDYKELKYMDVREEDITEFRYAQLMDVLAAKTDGHVYDTKVIDTKEMFVGYTGEGKGKVYVFNPLLV